jgi:predicted exporter
VLDNPEGNGVILQEAVRIINHIKTMLLGLFTLIGLIVLVFAIFTASVVPELGYAATSVFMAALVAAIVRAFALFGNIVYQMRDNNRRQH